MKLVAVCIYCSRANRGRPVEQALQEDIDDPVGRREFVVHNTYGSPIQRCIGSGGLVHAHLIRMVAEARP